MGYYPVAQIIDHPARPFREFYGTSFQVVSGDGEQMGEYGWINTCAQFV